jgi:hypothetical protein
VTVIRPSPDFAIRQILKGLVAARGDHSKVRGYGTGEPAARWKAVPGETLLMKRLIAIVALSTAFGLVACDDPNAGDSDAAEAPMEVPVALPAEDAGVPVAAPSAVDAPPVDSTHLPAEKRSSAESVQPESETLFY